MGLDVVAVTQLNEPIAIVGIGCRFPGGAKDPSEFWDFLAAQGSGIKEVPEDRWGLSGFYDPDPTAIARSTTKWGGFLDDVRRFDPDFFGISSREANSMDPQQRILLQVVYEALQDAHLRIVDIQAAKTGVFVGVSTSDYGSVQRLRRTTNDIYAGTGSALSIVSNRISHRLDLSGPSYSVDTACSSSLVALDQACWNLNEGTCSIAIAGGVNVLVDPAAFIAFSKAGMLSPTGTISTFDVNANGYVRGEGCGAVILKRLSDARRDRDRIYAVIRATSVNQDGHTATLTAPNPDRQVAMHETLCQRAGVAPASVDYVEAHGTGTPVGDPIEASALGRVFGMVREHEPVLIGSVKPNIGHLESAAGISGLIKTALVVHHRAVPPNRNFKSPNPNIPFEALGIAVPQAETPIGNGVCRAAVNSFGFGGTNASALLESADGSDRRAIRTGAVPVKVKEKRSIVPVPVSAATEASLQGFCGRVAAEMAPGGSLADVPLAEIAANLATYRDELKHRAVALATSRDHLIELLEQIAGDRVPEPEPRKLPHVVAGKADHARGVTFTFAGQGGQWWAMARQLLADEPAFRETVDRFDEIFRDVAGWSVVTELKRSETRSKVHDPAVTQPAIFAVQTGLAALWAKAGLTPDLIVGHSFGEVAAAYVAGALSLESAAALIHKRGLIGHHIKTDGAMLAVGLDPDQVRSFLDPQGTVDIAAFNGPTMVTLSGRVDEIEALHARLEAERPDVLVRRLAMNIAWHSRALEPAEAWFREAVGDIEWRTPAIPFISTVSGGPETCLDADYWWGNLRQPVAYEKAVGMALDLGAETFLEIGPHRTLSGLTATIAASREKRVVTANSLLQNVDDFHALGVAAGMLNVAGVALDWQPFTGPVSEKLPFPAYPWDEVECWSDSEESRRLLNTAKVHPLLGTRSEGPDVVWENEINLTSAAFIADHSINGDVIFPAAGYMDMLFAAGVDYFGSAPVEIETLSIRDALFIAQDDEVLLRTVFEPDSGRVRIFSHLRDSAKGWVERASAVLRKPTIVTPKAPKPSKARPAARLAQADFYALAARHGYDYGQQFQGAVDVAIRRKGIEAEIVGASHAEANAARHQAHPAVLDSSMQTAIPMVDLADGRPITFSDDEEAAERYPLYLPIGADRLRLFAPLPSRVRVFVGTGLDEDGDNVADYTIVDEDGAVCVTIDGFRSQRMSGRSAGESEAATAPRFFLETYVSVPPPAVEQSESAAELPEAGAWLVLSDASGMCDTLVGSLAESGAAIETVSLDDDQLVDADAVREAIAAWLPKSGRASILVGWALDTPALAATAASETVQAAVERNVLRLLALGQALDGLRESGSSAAVWLLTQGARSLPADPAMSVTGLAQAPLTGMMRTLASECREFAHHHVDFLDRDEREIANCLGLMRADTEESEIALRGDEVQVPRLDAPERESLPHRPMTIMPGDPSVNFVATMSAPGSLDAIRLEEAPLEEIGPDDVRIAVKAVGLNFRDIMAATGLLPEEAEREPAWLNLGLEYSGTVTATGAKVASLKPGDRVMGMGRRCLQGFINQPAAVLSKIPDTLSPADAATVPSAFATAHYALNHIARLSEGEKVLIHVATGGVGLAAIQLAKRAKAEIFATAGSDAKRRYLKKLGVKHVMNSRSHDFLDDIMRLTGGRGVDVVLNSLPGDFITKGLDALASFGRFLEIGKRDVYEDSLVGMKALRKNVTLSVIDLAAMGHERPELLQQLATEVMDLFAAGELGPLPSTIFPISDVSEAFRYMSQARHIGKVVVEIPDAPVSVASSDTKALALRSDGSYLVTGGSRGFGITIADWLSRSRAGRIVLASRSGRPDADSAGQIAAIEARGTEVVNLPLDITAPEAVSEAVASLAAGDKPLAGIVHGAAVIKDGFLGQLDTDTVVSVLRPKTEGAWNLHRALAAADIEPDFFVSFSSLAQVLGSIGQANYVAANAFLDAFAFYRRGQGHAGQTIDWGALGESGFVARSDSMTNYLESMGLAPVNNADATNALETLVKLDVPSIAFASVDWASVGRAAGKAGMPPRMRTVLDAEAGGGGRIRTEIAAAPREQWADMLTTFLIEQVGKVLKSDAEIDAGKALTELGFDSLSSIELKNRVEGQLGISIPVSAFLQTPTLGGLAEVIANTLEEELRQRAASSREAASAEGGAARASRRRDGFQTTHEQAAAVKASTGPLASDAGRRALEHRVRLQLRGAPDTDVVRRALGKLVRRHSLLRLAPPTPTAAKGVELSPGPAPSLQLVEDVAAAVDRPLAIGDGELVRAVYAAARSGGEIGLVVHAALTDRDGFATLVDDLVKLIDGETLDRRAPDNALRDALARRHFDETVAAANAARAHWDAVLRPPVRPIAFASRKRALTAFKFGANRGSTSALNFDLALPRHGEETEAFLLSAFAEAIAAACGTTDVAIERTAPVRAADVPAGSVGPFDMRFPVIVRGIGEDGRPTPFGQVRRQLRAGPGHATLGTGFVEEAIAGDGPGAAALRQFAFRYCDAREASLSKRLRGAKVGGKPVRVLADQAAGAGLHDLSLSIERANRSTLSGTVAFDADAVSAETARAILDRFVAAVAGAETTVSPVRSRTSEAKTVTRLPPRRMPAAAAKPTAGRPSGGDGTKAAVPWIAQPMAATVPQAANGGRRPNGKSNVYPVTPGQRWMLEALTAADCTRTLRQGLVLAQGIIVKPRLDVTRLRRAVSLLTNAHESLRTRFERAGDTWQAIVEPEHLTGLVVEDIASISDEELSDLVNRLVAEDYDVTAGPLFDIRLMRAGDRGDVVLMRVHHTVVDGWSLIKLFDDLFATYLGATVEFNPALSTAAFIREMDAQRRSKTAERNRRYWRSIVEPWLPTPNFGRVAKGIPLNLSGAWAPPKETIVSRIEGEAFETLSEMAKSSRVSTNSLLMAAFSRALAKAGDVDALYLGSLYPRRSDPVLKDYIGYLAADVPVRAECPSDLSVEEIAVNLHRQTSQSYGLVDLNFFINDVFKGAPEASGAYPRAICSGLAPEHLARTSPFEPLLMSGPGHSFRFGGMEVHTLPVPPRIIDDSEISLRPMTTKSETTLRLSYEALAFTRGEAEAILDDMLESVKLVDSKGDQMRRVESFGATQDWASVAMGQMPGPAGDPKRPSTSDPEEPYRAAGE